MQVEVCGARRLKSAPLVLTLALFCLLAGCALTSGGPAVAPAASFVVAAGEEFDVRLLANRSTGYSWALGAALDESRLTLVRHEYDAPAAGRPGEGGISMWRFRGVASGRTTLLFFYRRPWALDAGPARTMQYSVVVQ
ncbi:MAG: protease inhibitor I42 family protein [Deltaproteobacteria bacterium]